jgi:hypothetical protein
MVDGKAEAYSLPGTGPKRFKALRMLRDRNGALWIGTTGRMFLRSLTASPVIILISLGIQGL